MWFRDKVLRVFRANLGPVEERIVVGHGMVLIQVTEEFLKKLMTRTHDGHKMTVTMGKMQPDGTYSPAIAVEDDGKVVVDRFVLDEWRVWRREQAQKGKKGGLVAVSGGKITPVQ